MLSYELHLILIADKLRFFVLPLIVLRLFKGQSSGNLTSRMVSEPRGSDLSILALIDEEF